MISVNLSFLIITITVITSVLCLPIDENETTSMIHEHSSNNHEHNQFSVQNCDG